jgi:hypothetical protein
MEGFAMRTCLIAIYLLFFTLALAQPVRALNDAYSNLANLKIGDIPPSSLLQQGQLVSAPNATPVIYRFPSSVYANHQLLYLENKQISFLQVTLPTSSQAKFTQQLLNTSTTGMVDLPKNNSEMMYAFPSQGIAYIADGYRGKVIRIQYFPHKTEEEFVKTEGKNYTPQIDLPQLTSQPLPLSASSSSTRSTGISSFPWIVASMAGLFAIICLIGWVIYRLNQKLKSIPLN